MKLSEALGRPSELQPPAVAGLKRLISEVARVLQKWPDVVAEPLGDRERILRDFDTRLARGTWEGLTMARALTAARIAFDADFRDREEFRAVRSFLIAEIRASSKASFIGGMCSVYLSSFATGAPHSRDLAAALATTKVRLSGKWQSMTAALPRLFEPERAPGDIAEAMQDMPNPWLGLKAIGFASPHAPGMLDAAHLAFVSRMAPFLDRRASAEKLVDWLRPENQAAAREAGAPEAIDALLAPWQAGTPPDSFRDFLLESLRSLYGDPRVRKGTVWDRVSQVSRTIIMRWLTGENIRFFLDVVSRVEDSHMWAPRRKFWLGLHEQRKIDEAWVAFSPEGVRVARQIGRDTSSGRNLVFGRQTAGAGRSNTSLLVLRLGHCIVVEGSHSYKVHIFRDTNPRCPRLFQAEYDCEQIRLIRGAEAIPHHANWQNRVLEQIEYYR